MNHFSASVPASRTGVVTGWAAVEVSVLGGSGLPSGPGFVTASAVGRLCQ